MSSKASTPMWVSHQLDEPVYRAAATDSTAIVTKVPLMATTTDICQRGLPRSGDAGNIYAMPGFFFDRRNRDDSDIRRRAALRLLADKAQRGGSVGALFSWVRDTIPKPRG